MSQPAKSESLLLIGRMRQRLANLELSLEQAEKLNSPNALQACCREADYIAAQGDMLLGAIAEALDLSLKPTHYRVR